MQNKSALRKLEAHAEAVTLRQCLGLVVEHCMLDDHMERYTMDDHMERCMVDSSNALLPKDELPFGAACSG